MKRPTNLRISPDDSQDDAQAWRYFRQRDFTGGENRQLLPEFLKPNQLLLAFNCVLTGEGVPETRTGKSAIHDESLGDGPIVSAHRYAKEDGTEYIVEQWGTSLYAYEYDGTTVFTKPVSIATSLDVAKFRSRVWKDTLILTNGVDNPKTWDGTTFADLGGSPPKSKYLCVYASRLWFVDAANPNQIRFSGLENMASWDALDIIYLRDGDGDVITGFSPQPGGLLIFKNSSIWPLYGTSYTDMRIPETPMSEGIGCIAPDTILDEGFFLGAGNMYTFDINGIAEVSDTHRTMIENMSLADKQAAFAITQTSRKRVLLHLPNLILCIDGRYKGITSWDNLNASCFALLNSKDDDGTVLIGDASMGVVYKLDSNSSDAGAPIPTTIQMAYLDYGSVNEKVWAYFQPEMESLGLFESSITLDFDIDYSLVAGQKLINNVPDNTMSWDVSNWGEANWGGVIRINEPFFMHTAQGNRISFRIRTLDRIKFFGYLTKYRETGAI